MVQEDLKILGALSFYVGRRDVGSESKEELIDIALNNQISLERLSFLHWKDRNLIKSIRERDETQFTFFWETKSPFSQWYKSSFISSEQFFHQGINEHQKEYLKDSLPKELEFCSAEQFMMYHKAIIFLDREIAKDIMKTSNPRKIKELGRQVKNYDDEVWKYHRSNIVYIGNFLKFKQNPAQMNALINTMGTTLVEAAPNDKIWGIGLKAENPKAKQRETWEGKNLLGEILTLLRMEFMDGIY
ncbi:NADAR family protein [Allomuricauda sp. d1]|uniref:NADAR family protein n=1 Tax=Allomuricauda sp. d1 TaxID=3136725 RepID=UPI0031CF5011